MAYISSFTTNTVTGTLPLTVFFTDTSGTPAATSWSWDFGDASPVVTTQNPTHVYSAVGSYNVVLTSNNGTGPVASAPTNIVVTAVVGPSAFSGQRVKVQGGQVRFEAADPAYDLNLDVEGAINVTKQLVVGNDPLATGTITTPTGQDLIISPAGSLKLSPGAAIILNNVAWPTGSLSVTPGQFLGASGPNALEFISFILGFNGSDTLTTTQLNTTYPTAQPGQSVIGPTVVYECVSAGQWRTLGGGGGGGPVSIPSTQVGFGSPTNTLTSSANLTYNSATETFTIAGTGTALIAAGVGQDMNITADGGVTLTANANTFEYDPNGTVILNGAPGYFGDVLTSQGPGAAAQWTAPASGGSVQPLVAQLSLTGYTYTYFDGSVNSNWNANIYLTSPNVHWDSGTSQLLFTVAGIYKITVQGTIIPGGTNFWPDNLTQFGSQLYGFNVIGSTNSRHSTWTGTVPQDFRGIAANLAPTPNPATAVYSDEYIIEVGVNTYQPVGQYAACYTSSTQPWGGNLVITVSFIG